MRRLALRHVLTLRGNYWFWPSAMTLVAVVLGFALPWVDSMLGSDWTRHVGFIRATQVDGARAILTTLAAAALGVAGVAFSITMVAVSFATSNYGPRLIGNFMSDRTNQLVLGVLVATFVYCITVLSTVHARAELAEQTLEGFVPQVSVLFALVLTLASVGALIGYIHHIPESIDIMNLTAGIGAELRRRVIEMAEDAREGADGGGAPPAEPGGGVETTVRAQGSGFLQWVDYDVLTEAAREHALRVRAEAAAGEFLVEGELVITVRSAEPPGDALRRRLEGCYALGPSRSDAQDVLFLSDQLVEVAVRALSPGINDPHTAMLCIDWLRAGLDAFARAAPLPPPPANALVTHPRMTFEAMLDRSFDRMRQHVAADRTVALHALDALASFAAAASHEPMAEACRRQMRRLAAAAGESLGVGLAREEVEAHLAGLLAEVKARRARPTAVRAAG